MEQGRTWVFAAVVTAAVAVAAPIAGAKGISTLEDRHEVVFRTSDDGVTLRVVTGEGQTFSTPGACDGPGCLPRRCQPVRAGYLAASTRDAVGEGYFDVFRRRDDTISLAAAGSFGDIVDQPVAWAVVQVTPPVERVDATFIDGGRDSVEPVDGWAALAAPLDRSANAQGQVMPARLVARDADGERIGRLLVRTNTPWPGPPESCNLGGLPQEFPKATGRVPDDAAGAQAAIVETFRLVYGGAAATGADALALVDDGDSLREVTRIASDRYPEYAGKITATVDGVRFVDDDQAAVKFTLDVPGLGTGIIPGGVGTAVLRDGKWLVARETFCTMLAAGAVYCPLPSRASTR